MTDLQFEDRDVARFHVQKRPVSWYLWYLSLKFVLNNNNVECTLVRWLIMRYPRNRRACWGSFQCAQARPLHKRHAIIFMSRLLAHIPWLTLWSEFIRTFAYQATSRGNTQHIGVDLDYDIRFPCILSRCPPRRQGSGLHLYFVHKKEESKIF